MDTVKMDTVKITTHGNATVKDESVQEDSSYKRFLAGSKLAFNRAFWPKKPVEQLASNRAENRKEASS